jgi:hypothetical protein
MWMRIVLGMALVLAATQQAGAQCVSLTTLTPYTQNFDSLANTGTSSAMPTGWFFSESGTSASNDGKYTAGTGSSNAGDTYSFGAAGSTERALGTLLSGTLTPTIGGCFTNSTGGSILVKVNYTGEQWRLGQSGRGADRLDFQYSTNATSIVDAAATWTDVNALDFNSPITTGTVGALNGNLAANRTVLSSTTVAVVDPGGTLYLRWNDFNVTGSDDGLGIDDFTLTPTAGILITYNPSSLAAMAFGGTLSQPVTTNGTGCTFTPVNFPAWLSLTGVTDSGFTLSGTPSAAASYSFGVSADCANGAGAVTYSLLVFSPLSCGAARTAIHTIQGTGLTSAMVGTVVEIEGIVVGSYQSTTTGESGFFLQEPDADWDADPNTSEGIFIFDSGFGIPVQVGDWVRVKGTVSEFPPTGQSLTELNAVSGVQVCSNGNTFTRTTVTLPVASATDWEKYEGMAIKFSQTLKVTGNFSLGQFGQVDLAPSVLVQPTQFLAPGAGAVTQQSLNDLSRIQLDDASEIQDRFPGVFPAGGLSAAGPCARCARATRWDIWMRSTSRRRSKACWTTVMEHTGYCRPISRRLRSLRPTRVRAR